VAQKVQTVFIDDMDGTEAIGTIRFSLDGTEYEIDLNAGHSDALRSSLAPYVTHARKVGSPGKRSSRSRRGAGAVDTTAVRAWARDQGIEIKDRGRVPAGVVARYREATGK